MSKYLAIFILTFLSLLDLPSDSVIRAELNPGSILSQANWQEAKGLLPDPILRRFQDGKYRAKVITLPDTLGWGGKL